MHKIVNCTPTAALCPKKPARVAAPSPRASLRRRTVCGRTEQRRPQGRSVAKLRLEWYGGLFLLLQQRSKHPREMVITSKASSSHFCVEQNSACPKNCTRGVGLYKILFHFEAVVHKSTILSPPPAHLHFPPWCNTIARLLLPYKTPLPTSRLYAIHHARLVITISCKGQAGRLPRSD